MRLLLDECVPRPLKRELRDYEVKTVVEMGWAGKKNPHIYIIVCSAASPAR